MMKQLIRLLFFPLIIVARMIATLVVWIMEDDAKLIETWKEMK